VLLSKTSLLLSHWLGHTRPRKANTQNSREKHTQYSGEQETSPHRSHREVVWPKSSYSSHQSNKLSNERIIPPSHTWNHRIIEPFRLEKTSKISESNHKPNTDKSTTKPCPTEKSLDIFFSHKVFVDAESEARSSINLLVYLACFLHRGLSAVLYFHEHSW